MKQIRSLKEIIDIELNVSGRLGLFNESPTERDNTVDFKYTNNWSLNKSMWDYRWESDDSDICMSLKWLNKPQTLRKMITSVRNYDHDCTREKQLRSCGDLLNVINKITLDGFNSYYKITQHNTRHGHYSHSTFDIYITRLETDIEFKARSEAQIKYINGILKAKFKHDQKVAIDYAMRELAQYELLRKKFGLKE